MNNRLLKASFFSLLVFVACEQEKVKPTSEGGPLPTTDYLIFGHLGSFCMNCDAVYKIKDGKLYGTNHQMIYNPDSVELHQLPDSSYQLVKELASTIPSQLLNENASNIGSYFPDAGHFYIEVSRNQQVKHWYIEEGAPEYLNDFLSELRDGINKLNNE